MCASSPPDFGLIRELPSRAGSSLGRGGDGGGGLGVHLAAMGEEQNSPLQLMYQPPGVA